MWRLALFETGVQILTYVKSDINIDGVYKYQRVFQYKQQKKNCPWTVTDSPPVPKSSRKD